MTPLLKTVLFTALVPGTVAGLVPAVLRGGALAGLADAPPWRAVPGAAVVLAGAAVYAWCAWDFATAGPGTPSPTDPPRALVVRGLYRYSRNPMYVGVLLAVAGQGLWAGSPPVLAYATALAVGFHLRVVLAEEPALRRAFGAAYDAYAARVPRWAGRRGRPSGRPARAA